MKNMVTFAGVALAAALLGAQVPGGAAPRSREAPPPARTGERRSDRPAPELTEVSGTLVVDKGSIALKSADATYRVPQVGRLVGFVEGLKEGAAVTIAGYVFGDHLAAQTLTLGSKSYDLAPDFAKGDGFGPGRSPGPGDGPGPERGFGPGPGNGPVAGPQNGPGPNKGPRSRSRGRDRDHPCGRW
jgi:hypothetical protein